jgi:hypothetical protein
MGTAVMAFPANRACAVHGAGRAGGSPVHDRQFTKVVGFWAPRRWLTAETMDVDGLVAEIEATVRTRGLVAYDGQVITSLRRVGPWEACFEQVSIDTPLDIPRATPLGTRTARLLRRRAALPDG